MPASRPAPSGGAILARLGFDRQRLSFALRTTIAACLALFIALAIGLEHPQWSAMTVFAAAQPTRGQLFQKSANRLAGTIVGTAVGLVMLLYAQGSIWALTFMLALWVSLCTAIGNLIRGYGSYGMLLAGYSAAMVALLGQAAAGHELALGIDRFLTVLLGAGVGIAAGWIGSQRLSDSPALGAARRLLADTLLLHAARLARTEPPPVDHLLSRAALLDESLDPRAPATPRHSHIRQELLRLLAATTELILLDGPADDAQAAERARALGTAAEKLRAGPDLSAALPALAEARALGGGDRFAVLMDRITTQITRIEAPATSPATPRQPDEARAVAQHRDWVGARQAGLRIFVVLMVLGAFWALTEWPAGSLLLLGTSVMLSVFSTFDNPAWIMARVGAGQAAGALASLACLWLAWPLAQSSLQMALLMVPFLLVTPFLIGHRRTAPGAVDYAMVFLLLLQPTFPVAIGFGESLGRALAVVAGPAFAYLGFRMVFATDERRRAATVQGMILSELEASAQASPAQIDEAGWTARFSHRLLLLIRMREKSGAKPAAKNGAKQGGNLGAETTARALQSVGEAIHQLQALRRRTATTPQQMRAITTALSRLGHLQQSPERAGRALLTAARRQGETAENAGPLSRAGRALIAHPALFAPQA